jgi:hypothetical protein
MFWHGGVPGFSFEVNPDVADQGVEIDSTAMKEEFEKFSNGLQRYMALTGVSSKQHAPAVADPTGHIESNLKAIAIAKGIPFRILFGSEQAQLASGQDARNFNKRLRRRQTKYLTPMLVLPLALRLVAAGVLPEPKEIRVDWPDLMSPSDEDRAKVLQLVTDALSKYVAGNVDQLVPPQSFFNLFMGMSQEEIASIADEAQTYQDELTAEEDSTEDQNGSGGTDQAISAPDEIGKARN